jgi:heptosyltransferase-2
MELPLIHFDCRHFLGSKPCFANKQYGVFCSNCNFYEKENKIDEFPPIGLPEAETSEESHKKIIIIKLDAAGDVLRTTSLLPTLKQKYPDSSIIWITKDKSFEVLKDNELIDEIYFSTDELSHIYSDDFDMAINLDSGEKSCAIMSEITSKERFGYYLVNGKPYPVNTLANEWYLMGVDDSVKKENVKTYHQIIHEICNLKYNGSKPMLKITPEKLKRAEELKEKFGLNKYNEFILVNLGGGSRWQYKKWTKEGCAELVNRLSKSSLNRAVGIIAGDEDRDFYEAVSDEIISGNNVIRFGCDNPLADFICIIEISDKIFTSDSLAFHIATALSKFVVVAVGPTSHTELDVFGKGKIIYSDNVDCLCCYLSKCDKTVTCMNTLKAENIIRNLT